MTILIEPKPITEDEEKLFEEVVVKVSRTAKVVSGGKRMKFSALVVIGNRSGKVGFGYGKAPEVPFAVMKAIKRARKNVISVPLAKNHTLAHRIRFKQTSSDVVIIPASEGTGLKAGYAVRAMLSLAGIKDALSKVYGSTNPVNVVKATFEALRTLKGVDYVEQLRGVSIFTPVPVPYKPKTDVSTNAAQVQKKDEQKPSYTSAQLFKELQDALKKKLESGDKNLYTLGQGKKLELTSSPTEIKLKTEDSKTYSIKFDMINEFIEALLKEKSISNVSSKSLKGFALEETDLITTLVVELLPKRFKTINQGRGVTVI